MGSGWVHVGMWNWEIVYMYRGRVGSDITGVWTTYLVGVIVCLLAYRLGVEIRVPIQDTTVDWNLFEETCWAE